MSQHPLPKLVATIAARDDLPLAGTWDIAMPEKVVQTDTGNVDVAVTLYALREAAGIHALLLTQRNVLPSDGGWGPPSACDGGKPLLSLSVYQSPRDVLCGWANPVSFTASGTRARVGTVADVALGDATHLLGSRADTWLLIGLRVSNRSDFLDLQLLIPDQPEVSRVTIQPFLADMAHSLDATWLSEAPAAVPPPPPKKPLVAAAQSDSWWSGTLSASAMKTATYRVGVSVKTFAVASLMAGNAATGGAIITILNFTSTGIYLANDYLWETWNPLAPAPQDFVHLVDAP